MHLIELPRHAHPTLQDRVAHNIQVVLCASAIGSQSA